MRADVLEHFGLVNDFRNVGYFETEHHRQIYKDLKAAIRQGKMIAVSGIVGCGKTTTLRNIQRSLSEEREIIVSKSLSVEKHKVTLNTLFMALFYDLSPADKPKIPTLGEKRERELQKLIKLHKKPVALFVDEAHDLHGQTLRRLKRIMEVVQDCGGTFSIVLTGHPKLKNDLLQSSFEEIGSRIEIFDLNGITASKREYIEWLLEKCTQPDTDIYSVIDDDAIDLLAERLQTPLQIEHHLSLAFSEAFNIGEIPVNENIIKSILLKDMNNIEPRLVRYGYNTTSLAEAISVRPKVIRSFFKGKLSPEQTLEIQTELLAAGIPL